MAKQVGVNLIKTTLLAGCIVLGSVVACSRSANVFEQADLTIPGDQEVVEIKLLAPDSLDGWEITNFGGEGDCFIEDGELVVEMGYPLSGVTCTRDDLPTDNYEILLEAKRTQGIDFFCGLTFPVDDSHCTFIVGGWAGAVVGLSNVDENDAARNETKTLMKFEDDRWYKIRIVVGDSIKAWIDEKQVIDISRSGHKFSLRAETLICRPLGICTFDTSARYRNILLRTAAKPKTPEKSDD